MPTSSNRTISCGRLYCCPLRNPGPVPITEVSGTAGEASTALWAGIQNYEQASKTRAINAIEPALTTC